MKRRLALLVAIGSVLVLMLALNLGVASAHKGGETFTFGKCVNGGVVEPGKNGTGIVGDGFYGPFNGHEHNAFSNNGKGKLPFDIGIGCA